MADGPGAAAESPRIVYYGSTIAPAAFAQLQTDTIQWKRADELFARRGGTDAAVLIDAELVRMMIASRAYARILDEDWHRF